MTLVYPSTTSLADHLRNVKSRSFKNIALFLADMSGLFKAISTRTASALRGSMITQKASVYTRPAKEPVGPVESIIGLGMFSLAILGPSGWILANIENYKKRE
ncbi:cytochrome c oxidase subunit 8A, mitochondrial [Esox lucius]|nr:cytochrome c oxidase subunit 8A, mitochondrial [Esox lucius]